LDALEARAPDVVTMPLAAAADRIFRRRDVAEAEARTLAHGGPLPAVGILGPYAVFAPGGEVIAVVAERDGRARPEVVFTS
jgi:tRNA pseudouridine55 synthase